MKEHFKHPLNKNPISLTSEIMCSYLRVFTVLASCRFVYNVSSKGERKIALENGGVFYLQKALCVFSLFLSFSYFFLFSNTLLALFNSSTIT